MTSFEAQMRAAQSSLENNKKGEGLFSFVFVPMVMTAVFSFAVACVLVTAEAGNKNWSQQRAGFGAYALQQTAVVPAEMPTSSLQIEALHLKGSY